MLTIAGLAVGWLSIKSALIRTIPFSSPGIMRFAPDHPEIVLGRATTDLVTQHGILAPVTLSAVRRAAASTPLDARAYLILGHQQLLDNRPQRAVATLEAGQRLDPRQRLIHLLLLDRYLRTQRYGDAATQFSVLARLVGESQAPIAKAMAGMMLTSETRDAARRTLRIDPVLERAVLLTLAKSNIEPKTIFALASPAAHDDASAKESWGPPLVDRLIQQRRYMLARSVWQRIYRVPPVQAKMPITNVNFHKSAAIPPFDWILAAGSLGAANLQGNALTVDYYGRDSGILVSQLLVLTPGRYRFAFTVDPGQADTASKLFWSLSCGSTDASTDSARLMNVPVIGSARSQRIAVEISISPNCPAQTLALRGEAGDFAAPLGVTIRNLDLHLLPKTLSATVPETAPEPTP